MSYEVIGKLHKKFEAESKTDTFQAREFVIEIDGGTYPQFIKFQLVQDRCALVDAFREGEPIKVHFDLRGREWNGKYFTNLNAWRVEKVEQTAATATASTNGGVDTGFPSAKDEPTLQADDDLPF